MSRLSKKAYNKASESAENNIYWQFHARVLHEHIDPETGERLYVLMSKERAASRKCFAYGGLEEARMWIEGLPELTVEKLAEIGTHALEKLL